MTTLTDRQKLVEKEIKKYHIDEGAHSAEDYEKKVSCIMEAVCLVLGYDPENQSGLAGYLNPPCISAVIKDTLVGINDAIKNDQHRGALKSVAPYILNTAPTYEKVTEFKTKTVRVLRQDRKNAEYLNAERKRRQILKDAGYMTRLHEWEKRYYDNPERFLYDKNGRFQKKKTLDLIHSLIDVAKFEDGKLVS